MDRRTSDGFVTTAHWRANAEDGGFTASVYGSCGWGEGEHAVPYEGLTEEAVLAWCFENGVNKVEVETSLTAQIEAQKAPKTASGTPWATVEA